MQTLSMTQTAREERAEAYLLSLAVKRAERLDRAEIRFFAFIVAPLILTLIGLLLF